jgi:hypothetical protein
MYGHEAKRDVISLSTSPPLSPSPDEVSQERGSNKKRGFAPLKHPAYGVGIEEERLDADAARVAWVGKDKIE